MGMTMERMTANIIGKLVGGGLVSLQTFDVQPNEMDAEGEEIVVTVAYVTTLQALATAKNEASEDGR